MDDLQTFYDWMISSAQKSKSAAQHYRRGLRACSRDFIEWKLVDKQLTEMSLSELDVAIQKAFLSTLFIDKNARGNNMYRNSLKQYRNFLAVHDAFSLDTAFEKFIVSSTKLTATEKTAVINARVGQGIFRKRLFEKYEGRCVITGADDARILLASHVRPWAVSTNEQRLSAENGLLLSPLYDRLFDVGLITFTSEGQIICSKELENRNIDLLSIDTNKKYDLKLTEDFAENLRYHQDVVFLGKV